MFESIDTVGVLRNFVVYAVGVGLAVAGALGLAEAIELAAPIAAVLFFMGLVVVVAVHEYMDGPI